MSTEQNNPFSADVENFLDAHFIDEIKGTQYAAAIVHAPVFTRGDGAGPNAPILDGTLDPDLKFFVDNNRYHVAALAVLAVEKSGLIAVSLVPDNGYTTQTKGRNKIQHPVTSFGRPVSATSDFGIPRGLRDWSEQFSGLAARIDSMQEDLFGLTPDGLQLIGGAQNGRTDADRLARPALKFGYTRGLSVPNPQQVDLSLVNQVLAAPVAIR